MRPASISVPLIPALLVATLLGAADLGAIGEIKGFVFDAEQKEFAPAPGSNAIPVFFAFTNHSDAEVAITTVRSSCGCTTLNLPALPWTVGPGAEGRIAASIDITGKYGVLMKSISIESSAGTKHLILKLNLPTQDPVLTEMNDRIRNQQLAMVDRQIVFRGDCARCHAAPAAGKLGKDLFDGVCAVCHDTPHRATMVPDLFALNKPTDASFWRTWIMFGREGSLMPAFHKDRGGPLSQEQVDSLVSFLLLHPQRAPGAAPNARTLAPPPRPPLPTE